MKKRQESGENHATRHGLMFVDAQLREVLGRGVFFEARKIAGG
jgi:hypothetical protein